MAAKSDLLRSNHLAANGNFKNFHLDCTSDFYINNFITATIVLVIAQIKIILSFLSIIYPPKMLYLP
jgi:hypothetical protein